MDDLPANSNLRRRGEWLVRAWGAVFLLLVAVTWPLWQSGGDFPAVPLFAFGAALPDWLQGLAVGAAIVAATSFVVSPSAFSWRTAAILIWAGSLLLLVVADQQRLQAWVWHGWLVAGILLGAKPEGIVPAMRWLTAGLYFHSALSKLDATFVSTLGRDFFLAPLQPLGFGPGDLPAGLLVAGALAFPLVELAVAVLVVLPEEWRTARWLALAGAAAMHLGLLAILGPLGLNHQWGVLLWNLFFLVQAVVLFTPLGALPGESESEASDSALSDASHDEIADFPMASLLAYAALFLGIGLPCFAPWGLCDPWPAWELYAPRVARADLAIPRDSASRLPADLAALIEQDRSPEDAVLVRVPLDRWSLARRGAPLYPHPRVQLAIALELVERYELAGAFETSLASSADRWTGRRTYEPFRDLDSLRAATDRYWLNAKAK